MLLKKLNHPAIIKIFGINFHSFKNEEILKPTILMEYIPKGTLYDLINLEKKGIAPKFWTFTKKYINLVGISHAMSCLHKNGVIYRDLKPDNIFFDEDFYLRIYNFTYCPFFSHPLDSSMLLLDKQFGTPLYMAPEVLMGAVDVYSFAITAYEILTTEEPYGKINIRDLNHLILSNQRPKFNSDFTEPMKKLISRCWSQNSSDRPSFGEIL